MNFIDLWMEPSVLQQNKWFAWQHAWWFERKNWKHRWKGCNCKNLQIMKLFYSINFLIFAAWNDLGHMRGWEPSWYWKLGTHPLLPRTWIPWILFPIHESERLHATSYGHQLWASKEWVNWHFAKIKIFDSYFLSLSFHNFQLEFSLISNAKRGQPIYTTTEPIVEDQFTSNWWLTKRCN